ncbi:unnamed protein product [Phytomonas sp. EM1]|nr:unnamed protein product [Phytomonas sp. EM1]|eukprot:CCW59910.1 unnamed protein product [Phytomonas sp. isolate EM1]
MDPTEDSDLESQQPSDISLSDNDRPQRYTISQTLFEDLQKLGFSENAIKKSIVAGCIDQSTCVQWITMHVGHPELDAPLADGVEVTIQYKKVLTEAEREQKAKEIRDKIKQKKEEEERESHRKKMELAEMWRKSLDVKKEMDKVRHQMRLDEMKKSKTEDHAAYRKVKIGIIADRYIRQGKSVEEANALAASEYDDEQSRKRQAAAERFKEVKLIPNEPPQKDAKAEWDLSSVLDSKEGYSSSLHALCSAPPPSIEELPALAEDIRRISDQPGGSQCLRLLLTIIGNILEFPFDVKKRTLKTSSKSLVQHVFPHKSAIRLMRLCNFDLEVDENDNEIIVCKTVVIHLLDEVIKSLK